MTNRIRIAALQFTLSENSRAVLKLKKKILLIAAWLIISVIFFGFSSLNMVLFVLGSLYLGYLFYCLYRYRQTNKRIIKKIKSLTKQ